MMRMTVGAMSSSPQGRGFDGMSAPRIAVGPSADHLHCQAGRDAPVRLSQPRAT